MVYIWPIYGLYVAIYGYIYIPEEAGRNADERIGSKDACESVISPASNSIQKFDRWRGSIPYKNAIAGGVKLNTKIRSSAGSNSIQKCDRRPVQFNTKMRSSAGSNSIQKYDRRRAQIQYKNTIVGKVKFTTKMRSSAGSNPIQKCDRRRGQARLG